MFTHKYVDLSMSLEVIVNFLLKIYKDTMKNIC